MMHLDRVHGVFSKLCIFLKQNLALAHFNEQPVSNLPQQLTHNLILIINWSPSSIGRDDGYQICSC